MRRDKLLALVLSLSLLAGLLPLRVLADDAPEDAAETAVSGVPVPSGETDPGEDAPEESTPEETAAAREDPPEDAAAETAPEENAAQEDDPETGSDEPVPEEETPGGSAASDEPARDDSGASGDPSQSDDETEVPGMTLNASRGNITLSGDVILSEDVEYDVVTVSGAITINLNGYAFQADRGIVVAAGSSLTIWDGSGAATGTLTATGGTGAAGIGGADGGSFGSVTIAGGTVTASGGEGAAGIGGGRVAVSAAGTITINGGAVTATGGSGGAGIGSGSGGAGSYSVVIGGGEVSAAGGEVEETSGGTTTVRTMNAIGAGDGSTASGSVEISGGVVHAADINVGWPFSTGTGGRAFVFLEGTTIDRSDEDNWYGFIFFGGEGKLYCGGDTYYSLSTDATIPSGAELSISGGKTLAVSGTTLTNNGTIRVGWDGKTDDVVSAADNVGTLAVSGATLANNGTIRVSADGTLNVSSGAVANTGTIYIDERYRAVTNSKDGKLEGVAQVSGNPVLYKIAVDNVDWGGVLPFTLGSSATPSDWYQAAGQPVSATFKGRITNRASYGPLLKSVKDGSGTELDSAWAYNSTRRQGSRYITDSSAGTVSFTMPESVATIALKVRPLLSVNGTTNLYHFYGDTCSYDLSGIVRTGLSASDLSIEQVSGSLQSGLTYNQSEKTLTGIYRGYGSSTNVFVARDSSGRYAPNYFFLILGTNIPAYTVTIPATLTLDADGEDATEFTVKAEDVVLGSSAVVRVRFTGSTNGFLMRSTTNSSATVGYVGNYSDDGGVSWKPLSTGLDTLLDVAMEDQSGGVAGSGSVKLSFRLPASSTWIYAGEYTDNLNFTITTVIS